MPEQNKNKSTFFLAFIIPVVILVIIYFVREIYPFGENCFLRSDMYHQYAPFLKEFYNKITQGGSLTYSWNIGGGSDFTAIYAYYLASPANWLIRFVPDAYTIEFMNALLIIKTGLASFTFCYYLSKRYNSRHLILAAFSIFYALSSYMAAFNWNVMWLDCIVLLPLIVLGIERLIKYNKCFLYCITLALSIFSNYYISIMICIFTFLYFIINLFTINMEREKGFYKKRILNFILYSLIAGGLSAILLIPVIHALSLTASGDFSFPTTLEKYFSTLKILSRGLMNVDPAIFSPHDPNIYSSVIVFLMFPLYCLNKNISKRDKIGKILLIVIFIVSFNFNIPNYIWHGFHFPNSLPCRQSFIFIFLMLTISVEAFLDIKRYTNKEIYLSFAGVFALFMFFENFFVDEDYPFSIIYISLIFVALYLLIIEGFRNKKVNKNIIVYILFIVTICEAAINTNETAFGTTSRTYYVSDNADIENVLTNLKTEDNSFYRTEKITRRTKNDAAWSDYRGISVFSSTANAGVTNFMGALGFEHSMNSYSYNGNTPLTASLLSVKYLLNNDMLNNSDLISLYDSSGSIYLYKNKYTLPLGFMLASDFENKFDINDNNPFNVQNNFVEGTTGYANMFTMLPVNNAGSFASSYITENEHVYAYIYSNIESATVEVSDLNGTNISSKTYDDLSHGHIIDIGDVASGSTINFYASGDNAALSLYVAGFNDDVFKAAYNVLNSNSLQITAYNDTTIKGKISSSYDGTMFTSIPYNKGFTVYVDGKKVKGTAFKDAFLSIPVSKGEHNIEIKYSPQGLLAGSIISGISLIIFLILIIGYNFHRKRHKD